MATRRIKVHRKTPAGPLPQGLPVPVVQVVPSDDITQPDAPDLRQPGETDLVPVVLSLPERPTSVVATKDDTVNSATVSWQPPVSDGGSPITGYRVARDGSDAAGVGAYSTVVAATVRTFTMTRLVDGATYRLSVEAITAQGTGPDASASVTLGTAVVAGPVQKTGTAYALFQNLTGVDAHGGDFNARVRSAPAGAIVSLEAKVYTDRDFRHPYGASPPYDAMVNMLRASGGISGVSRESSIIEIVANTGTKTPPTVAGSGENHVNMIAWLDPTGDVVLEDFTLRGTPQSHLYNGFQIARPAKSVTVRRCSFNSVPGNQGAPPGETFAFNLFRQPLGQVALFEDVVIDGGGVGAAGLGTNNTQGRCDFNNFVVRGMRYSAGLAAWQVGDASVLNLRGGLMTGNRRNLGAECIAGVVNVYDPVWGDPQETRFDVNFTYGISSGREWKNGKINFYFSSEAAWQRCMAARTLYPTRIRVVTNPKQEYGSGLMPDGTYQDLWNNVRVYFKDAAGAYVQRTASNYISFHGRRI